MERCHFDIDKKLRILNYFYTYMGIPINTDKKKNMIIKSKNDTYTNFICDNSNLHEVTSYKYLGIDIQH